jgi:Flp pilus assembly protein TadG
MSLIMRYVAALPKRFVADCRGVTSTLMALSFMGMLGFAGLATEVGLWYVKKRSMQSAADSAAFSAAIALSTGNASTEAQSVAGTYGFVDGSGGTTVTVNNPPTSGPNTSASAVEVTISQPQTFTIARLFLSNALTIQARSVAVGASGNGCVLALDTANVTDDSLSGGATLNLSNCSLYINSVSTHALSMSGGARINALSAFITGNYSTSGGATLNTTNGTFTGVAPIGDPYANVSIPSYSGCNQTNFHLSGGASQTLSVGSSSVYVFCNGLNLSGGASLTLNPGIYVINGGSFNLSGGTTFNATGGVTIVLTGSTAAGYATANISGGANVSITAPTSGPTAGLAFFQDRNAPSSGTDSFSGGTTQTITGAIYFPHQAVNYSGGATAGGSNCTQLIAYTMTFSGGSTFNNNCAGVGTAAIGGGNSRIIE